MKKILNLSEKKYPHREEKNIEERIKREMKNWKKICSCFFVLGLLFIFSFVAINDNEELLEPKTLIVKAEDVDVDMDTLVENAYGSPEIVKEDDLYIITYESEEECAKAYEVFRQGNENLEPIEVEMIKTTEEYVKDDESFIFDSENELQRQDVETLASAEIKETKSYEANLSHDVSTPEDLSNDGINVKTAEKENIVENEKNEDVIKIGDGYWYIISGESEEEEEEENEDAIKGENEYSKILTSGATDTVTINPNGGTATYDGSTITSSTDKSLGSLIKIGETKTFTSGTQTIDITGTYNFIVAGGAGSDAIMTDGKSEKKAAGGDGIIITSNNVSINKDTQITFSSGGSTEDDTKLEKTTTTGEDGKKQVWGKGIDRYERTTNGTTVSWDTVDFYHLIFGAGGKKSSVSFSGHKIVAAGGGGGAVMYYSITGLSQSYSGKKSLAGKDVPKSTADNTGNRNEFDFEQAYITSHQGVFAAGHGAYFHDNTYSAGKGYKNGQYGKYGMNIGAAGACGQNHVSGFTASYATNTAKKAYVKMACHSKTFTVDDPTREGYDFDGWDITFGDGVTQVDNGTSTTFTKSSAGDMTITAKWKIHSSSLVIYPNGGTWNGNSAPQSFTQNYNTTLYVPIPQLRHYTFTGWTQSYPFYGSITSLTSAATYTFGAENGVTSTLTANWRKAQSKLTVNPNGGVWNGSAQTQNFVQEYGSTKNIPVPTRDGWKFTQWDKNPDFHGTISSITENATYTFGGDEGENDTITAQWVDIVPPTSVIEPVTNNGNYTTETYTNPYNNTFWFKDYLDARIVSQDGNGSGIKTNFLSDANSSNMLSSSANPYVRHYDARQTDGNGYISLIGRAIDNAGNIGNYANNGFYIDGTAPTITGLTAEDLSSTVANGSLKGSKPNVQVDVTEGILSVEVDTKESSGKNWKNVNVKITASVYDLQSGLMSAALEKYDNGWHVIDTISYNGEIGVENPTFTITQTGKYRIAVYDKFAHVTYTNESEYWIDKIAPTITIASQEYGWINEAVPLHFDIADNIDGSGIQTLTFVKVGEDGTETPMAVTQNISADMITGSVDVTISEEGVTYYKLYAKDNAENESYVYVTVKIDYVAPTADVEAVLNDSSFFDLTLDNVVEELSGCDLDSTYFDIKDSDGIVPDVLTFSFNPSDYTNIHTGASFQYLGIDVMTKFENCDSVDVGIHIFDIAGNEQVYTKKVDIFNLQAELFRYLSTKDGNNGDYTAGETWKAGESGLVKVTAGSYIDRIEIIYPDEWISKQASDVTYPLDHYANVYNYSTPSNKVHEEDDFMIPTGVKDDNETYTIIVRAYKIRDGVEKMKEVPLPLVVNGSLLDDLRTRIRYK